MLAEEVPAKNESEEAHLPPEKRISPVTQDLQLQRTIPVKDIEQLLYEAAIKQKEHDLREARKTVAKDLGTLPGKFEHRVKEAVQIPISKIYQWAQDIEPRFIDEVVDAHYLNKEQQERDIGILNAKPSHSLQERQRLDNVKVLKRQISDKATGLVTQYESALLAALNYNYPSMEFRAVTWEEYAGIHHIHIIKAGNTVRNVTPGLWNAIKEFFCAREIKSEEELIGQVRVYESGIASLQVKITCSSPHFTHACSQEINKIRQMHAKDKTVQYGEVEYDYDTTAVAQHDKPAK